MKKQKPSESHKTFDPKSYYFHRIKQASREEFDFFFFLSFSPAKHTGKLKTNKIEESKAESDDKSLMNYDVIRSKSSSHIESFFFSSFIDLR